MGQENINLVASELKSLPQGLIPLPIFNEIARLAALTAIEFIPFRKNGESTEVLLFRRPADDSFWPGLLHTPGTILRSSDASFDDAYTRLFNDELNCEPLSVKFIGNELILNERGRVLLFKYIVDVTDVVTSGDFYDTTTLPDDVLPQHRDMMLQAVNHFKQEA